MAARVTGVVLEVRAATAAMAAVAEVRVATAASMAARADGKVEAKAAEED